MRPPHATRRSGPWAVVLAGGVAVCALLLAVVFVASSGPAAGMVESGRLDIYRWHRIYGPVKRLAQRSPFTEEMLYCYVDACGGRRAWNMSEEMDTDCFPDPPR
jgi:hypothetical protein